MKEFRLQPKILFGEDSLDYLKTVPHSLAFAYGRQKAAAILAVLRAGYVNHLVTDEATILKVLELDNSAVN